MPPQLAQKNGGFPPAYRTRNRIGVVAKPRECRHQLRIGVRGVGDVRRVVPLVAQRGDGLTPFARADGVVVRRVVANGRHVLPRQRRFRFVLHRPLLLVGRFRVVVDVRHNAAARINAHAFSS
jgi:hypothetical protein